MLILIIISTSISVIFNYFRSLWLSNEVSRAQRSLPPISKEVRGLLFYKNKGYIFTNFGLSLSTLRAFSTFSTRRNYSTNSTSLVVFKDADKYKIDILKFIKGKAGIYMWTNKLNGKKYVGSSVDLRRRLLEYYNVNRLLNEKSMPISVALLKYGYGNFTLTILETCDKDSLMSREKHFFEIYSPEYNILKTPGSPDRGSGWKHSEAAIENMRSAAAKTFKCPEFLDKLSKGQSSSIQIEVTDAKTNTSTTYHAIRAAARALSIDRRYIEHYIYLKQTKPVLGRYTFKLVNLNIVTSESLGQNTNIISVNKEKLQKTSMKVEVTNVNTKEITIYSSISSAARELGYRQPSISLYIKENRIKPFKGKYLFKLVN